MRQVVVDLLNGLDIGMVTIHVHGYGKIYLFLEYVKQEISKMTYCYHAPGMWAGFSDLC